MTNLKMANYTEARKQYNFPIQAIQNMVSRLGTNYGKQEQEIADAVRDVATYTQAMYQLATDGVKLMRSYRNALQQMQIQETERSFSLKRRFRKSTGMRFNTSWRKSTESGT